MRLHGFAVDSSLTVPECKAYLLLAYCIIALITLEYAASSQLTLRELKPSSILDSSPWQEFPARGGSPCQAELTARRQRASGSRGASSLVNRKARWTLRFVSGYVIGRRFGVDGFAKSGEFAERLGNHPVLCLFRSLSSAGIFRAGADPQKLPHSLNTRFPSGIGGRKLLITYRVSEEKKKIGII